MEKVKGTDRRKYIDRLDREHRERYMTKLSFLNGFDPYDASQKNVWSNDFVLIPPMDFPSLTSYLVFGVSAYSLEQFRAYKSLEAHMQFSNGWVHDLHMFSPQDCVNTVIKAKVLHSQRLNEKPLMPWVILDKTGNVVAAHCDCMAGLGETCTHVGALLFKIEAVVRIRERTTVTGVAAYWMIPSSVEKVQGKAGFKIDFTSANSKRNQVNTTIETGQNSDKLRSMSTNKFSSTPEPTQESINNFLQAMYNTGDRAVILSTVEPFSNCFKDPVKPVLISKSLPKLLRNSKCDSVDDASLFEYCSKIADSVNISEEEANKVERETRQQHKSALWFACRAGRVTASQLHAVCRFTIQKPAATTVKHVCYPTKHIFSSPATAWGVNNEQNARDCYLKQSSPTHACFSMQNYGFFISTDTPYMGASPDAIVKCDCCGRGCVEIKCPYKHRNVTVLEACKDRDFCLEIKDDLVQLKTDHSYYYQIQGEMLSSNSEYCDFVVWTSVDLLVLRIEPDYIFLEECKIKAKSFYINVILPELVALRFSVGRVGIETVTDTRSQTHLNAKRPKKAPQFSTNNRVCDLPFKKPKTLWCHCRRAEDVDDMVACDNAECSVEWYHISCVGLKGIPKAEEKWYCDPCIHNQIMSSG